MANHDLDQLTKQVEKLQPHEQILLMERIILLLRKHALSAEESIDADVETWDRAELEKLLKANHPLTTQEIVAAGLFGGWEELGIEDSQAWVEAQQAKTRNRYSW